MRRLPLFVATSVGLTGLLFLPYVLRAQEQRAARTRCASNMRQLGLAAAQYGDDKRFLPHVSKTRALDGDASTNHTTQSVRALVWYGYHDNPEGFVCSASDDYSVPIEDPDVRENMRLWFWGAKQKKGDNKTSPWRDGLGDPALNKTRLLSYGYTRRGYNRNVSSTKRMFADRAVRDGVNTGPMTGNHDDGWNVTSADCTVEFLEYSTETAKQLTGTEPTHGFLALKAQSDDSGFKPLKAGTPPSTQGWAGHYKSGTSLLRVSPRSYDRRSGRWSFTAAKLDARRTKPTTSVYGHVSAQGAMTGLPGSPFAEFKAVRKGDQLLVTIGSGETETYQAVPAPPAPPKPPKPPTPIARDTRELVALGLLGALRAGNVEAARAFFTKDTRDSLKKGELKALAAEAQDMSMDRLRALHATFAPRVVRDKDGIVRVDMSQRGAKVETGELKQAIVQGNEAAAIGALKTLGAAQSLFREGDKDGDGNFDYANSLEALGKARLIDKALASGVKNGYRFALRGGDFTWIATATPVMPGKTGKRHFATNHEGVIYYGDKPFPLQTKSPHEIKGGKPLGN